MPEKPAVSIEPHTEVICAVAHCSALDDVACNELQREVLSAAAQEPKLPMLLDLTAVKYVPSMGLGTLVMLNRKWETPHDDVYGATETANGELGFYVVGDGSGVPYRARTRPPSFIHFQLFPQLIVGHQISDVVAVLGSLNIIAAELDR